MHGTCLTVTSEPWIITGDELGATVISPVCLFVVHLLYIGKANLQAF